MKKVFLVQFLIFLIIIGLFFSCNLFQDRDPVFSSYGNLEGFNYSSEKNGDLTLFKPKSVDALGDYERSFKRNIRRKIKDKLGRVINIDNILAPLYEMESVTVDINFDQAIEEPAIAIKQVEEVASCPVPEIDTDGKTLLKAIDWKIFVTCELKSWNLIDLSDELDENEEQPFFKAYPPLEATDSYSDALEFITVSVLNSLYQNHGINASADEQLGFFERVFLMTKFRTLTQLEKESVVEIMEERGLFSTLKNHLLNWYFSDFYATHFDYRKNPDVRYRMTRLWGIVRAETEAGFNSSFDATDASYKIIDSDIRGHVLSGRVGGMKRLKKWRMLIPAEEARYVNLTGFTSFDHYRQSNFEYNMELQFYLPLTKFTRNRQGKVTDATVNPYPTVTIMVEKMGHTIVKQKIILKHRFTHPVFPNHNFTNNVNIIVPRSKIGFTPIPYTQSISVEVHGFVQGLEKFQRIRYHFRGGSSDVTEITNNEFRFRVQFPRSNQIVLHEVEVEIVQDARISFTQKLQFHFYPEYAPDRMVIRFQKETAQAAIDRFVSQFNSSMIHHIWKKLYVISLPQDSDVTARIKVAEEDNIVKYAFPDFYIFGNQAPSRNLPNENTFAGGNHFHRQWGLDNQGQNGGSVDTDIDAPEAWSITTGSRDVIVAVLDTGVNINHPDLQDNIFTNTLEMNGATGVDDDGNGYVDDIHGWDFCDDDNDPSDQDGHGTHVAGIIGAHGNNGMGIVGVNWEVRIMPLRILPYPTACTGTVSTAMRAIIYAKDMGVHITNNSWTRHHSVRNSRERRIFNSLLQEFSDLYTSGRDTPTGRADILHIFSAGNSGFDLTIPLTGLSQHSLPCHFPRYNLWYPCLKYPSYVGIQNKIVVASTNKNDRKARSSNYSPTETDIVAPGVSILSTKLGSSYFSHSGTSMAAPHVAGVAALVMAHQPNLRGKPLLVKESILQSADTPTTLQNTSDCPDRNGNPGNCVVNGRRLNAYNALRASTPPAKVTGLTLPPA